MVLKDVPKTKVKLFNFYGGNFSYKVCFNSLKSVIEFEIGWTYGGQSKESSVKKLKLTEL